MMTAILLDAGPLGMLANPKAGTNRRCFDWLQLLLGPEVKCVLPEIADYEVRRSLLKAKMKHALLRLDLLKRELDYDPITTEVMLTAAEFWALARDRGQKTADDRELDCDMILSAHAKMLENQGYRVLVATTNVGHLSVFSDARRWTEIDPAMLGT